ncbi:hypothetical protein [Gymnodinialimonas ulvae]|uniref:hypothetical protein n=1 Tax=Gymnodinialimonas ulvae TaxID=3126504 RepID=UPI0030A45A6A
MQDASYQDMADIVADERSWIYGASPPPPADGAAVPPWLAGRTYVRPEDRRAVFARARKVMARGLGDPALEVVARFEELFLINALFCGALQEARALVEARCPADHVARGEMLETAHRVQSMAACVLAMCGEDDAALAMMENLGQQGDSQFWRFNIRTEREGAPFARCGRDQWLDRIERTEPYQAILTRYLTHWSQAVAMSEQGPLRMAEDAVLGGKARKKCGLSGEKLAPGTEIVRYRFAFEGEVNEMRMASRAAFDASPLHTARAAFEANAVPLEAMFPALRHMRDWVRAPEIAIYYQQMADGAAFDPDRAAALITRPNRKPIDYYLEGEGRTYDRSVPHYHASEGHGVAGTLFWKLVRAGQSDAVADAAQALPDADCFFALAACYDDGAVAGRAARHFDLPDLPKMVALALKGRARGKTAAQLADYGAAHPRWRRAIAMAMERYALHLYSGFVPSVNWFYAGWERFSRAYGSSLMFFCTDTPDDIPALAHAMRERKLIRSGAGTASDCYSVCGPMFYQATLLSLSRNDPAELQRWLDAAWMTNRRKDPADRAMRKFVGG